jgi:dipeptidyl aminopeptidase/acylaminoacyl peptidase
MKYLPLVRSSWLLLLAACGGQASTQPATHPQAPLTRTLSSIVNPKGAPPAAGSADAKGYAGHGAASVPKEVLDKYVAPALPDDVARSIQAMLDVRAPGAGRLSNDGKAMYFGWNVTGGAQLWRLDGPQHFPVQLTGGQDPTMVMGIAPDNSFLLLSRDRKGEENPGLYLQDPKGGQLTLIQHKPGIQTSAEFISDDGRYIYFRSNDVKKNSYVLYRWDRTSKAREVVFDQDGIWSIADFKNAPGKKEVAKLLLAKEVGSNMAEYSEWDVAAKTLTPLFGQGEREEYEAVYSAKDGELIVQTPKLGEFRRLYKYDVAKKALSPITPEIKSDVASFSVDHAKNHIFYTVNDGGYSRLKVLGARTYKESVPAALGALKGDHVRFGAPTRDGRFWTLSVDSGKAPPSSFVFDWQSGKLTPWHSPSAPEIDTARFAEAKLETYPARDGTKIPMFVRRPDPARCAAKPCPVIVSFHGGPEGQTLPGFNTRSQIFVDAGFVFVEPNVRGSDGYGRTWIHSDDGPKRLNVITDIEDAAKYVRKEWADGGKAPKVGVMGGSYGGYSTLIAMTMFAGAYDAGVANVGMSSLVTFLQNTAEYRRILRASEYGDLEKDREALVKLSPVTYLGRVSKPLLVIQGASDPRVPVGEALQMHESLKKKNIPSELIIFADEGHGAQKRENKVLELGHSLRFFKQHLL